MRQRDMGQPDRSEREKALPEWVRDALDWARRGYTPSGQKITKEEARALIEGWLGK